jgi:tetratricopeptide (TPR) repeat protein
MPSFTPLPLALGRFKQLPQRSAEVWQGAIRKLPMWIDNPDDPDGPPFRPVAAFWVSLRTGLIHTELADPGMEAAAQIGLSSLLDFGLKWAKALEGRPSRVEVTDPRLRDALAAPLAALNTPVALVEDVPQLEEAFRNIEAHATGDQRNPGALEAPGVTPDRLRAFADAADRFFRARPWQHLCNEDLIVVETPKAPRGLTHACVMGNGGQEFGLAFFGSRQAFDRLVDAGAAGPMPTEVHGVTFGAIDDLPFADVDAWEAHALPVAGPRAYPLASRMRSDGTMTRPEAIELNHIEALLRALARTTEEEMDRGRWQHDVDTFDGPVTVTLTLPQLLEAERGDQSRARRPAVMPRLAERAGRQIARLLETQQFSSLDEVNAALEQARRDGVLDAPPEVAAGRSLTPLERAQDLAYDAMEAGGRLRMKLARGAIALSADCADAWIILGEAATDPDSKVVNYRHAVDAGARAIDDEFSALTGEFWGHLQTRPYMRARLALAQILFDLGRIEEALTHYRELLRLNPNDNQGVRWLLLPVLLEHGKDEEAGALLDQFDEDIQATWPYGRALWLFRREGDTERSRAVVTEAEDINPHVIAYLLNPESIPQNSAPSFTFGSKEEAASAADSLLPAFTATPGALAWLQQQAAGRKRRGHRGRHRSSSQRPRKR